MTSKTCFVHVGTAKTGSSALQYALARAQHDLLAQGYNFPDLDAKFKRMLAFKPAGGNAVFVRDAFRAKNVAGAVDPLRPFAKSAHHLILSNEGLWNASGALLDEFCDCLRSLGFQTKCLVLFRPQTELIVAAYLQKTKSTRELPKSLDEFAKLQDFEDNRSWFACAKKLEHAFGTGNVTVKWYPALRRTGTLVRAAFEWLGAAVPDLQIPDINPTPGQEALTILQLVNAHGFGEKKFADLFLSRAQQEGVLGSKITLSAEAAQRIHEATYRSNADLLRQYLPELLPDDELAAPQTRNTIPADPRIIERLSEIAADVLRVRGVDSGAIVQMFCSLKPNEVTA